MVGKRDVRITPENVELENLALDDKVYYLCGVSKSNNWAKNFHLAFRPCPGKTIDSNELGVHVVVVDAERLPISPEFIDPDDPNKDERLYKTCRNWQFAHYFNRFLKA